MRGKCPPTSGPAKGAVPAYPLCTPQEAVPGAGLAGARAEACDHLHEIYLMKRTGIKRDSQKMSERAARVAMVKPGAVFGGTWPFFGSKTDLCTTAILSHFFVFFPQIARGCFQTMLSNTLDFIIFHPFRLETCPAETQRMLYKTQGPSHSFLFQKTLLWVYSPM